MENKKSKKIGKYVVISLIVLGILVCFFVPSVNTTMNSILKMFASGDFTVVRQFVESYGAYAALVSFLLMILQSIAAPLPAFLLTFYHGPAPWQGRQYASISQGCWGVMQ